MVKTNDPGQPHACTERFSAAASLFVTGQRMNMISIGVMMLLVWFGISIGPLPFGQQIAAASERSPNVVVFLTDDQGWGDLSVSGNCNLSTPAIDRLAQGGASLNNFYVCQVCAPTRSEFLTGRYHPRTGVSGVSRGEERLNADETTIADVFKAAGYATGCFGKWHNGTQPPLHPRDRGFDEFYGFTSGHWGHYFSPPLDHNGRRVRGKGFIVNDLTDQALAFIKANAHQPFFCYVPYNTPHSPMMVPDRFYAKFDGADPPLKHRDPEREDIMMTRAALAMCENIDWNVARILERLDTLNLSDDTIVVYFSDNGPNSFRWNGGMKGRKGSLDEGGLRSPLFIRWPTHIAKGTELSEVVGAIDLLPTLTELSGISCETQKPVDGRSFATLLTGKTKDLPDRPLFSIRKKQVSVRTDRFRLDINGKLFDIAQDRGQRYDVSSTFPDVTARLRKLAAEHSAAMQPYLASYADRPFHVGFGPSTTLPARDGKAHGTIERSSKAPNNSFFTQWTSENDYITWNIHVANSGTYLATVFYTCASGNEGVGINLKTNGANLIQTAVTDAFDPPLYDKDQERVTKSHYFVKDFRPLVIGEISLKKGNCVLTLGAAGMKGDRVIDVHSIELVRTENE